MKRVPTLKHWLVSTACGLVAAGSLSLGQAQTYTNFLFCQFDTADPRQNGWPDSTSISFVKWWGEPTIDQVWDGTVNAMTQLGPNNAGSGSLKVTVNWATPPPDQNQLVFWQQLNGVNNWWDPDVRVSGFYYDVSFDIKFDPNSTLARDSTNVNIGPNYGRMEVGVSTPAWNQIWCLFGGQTYFRIPVTNDWIHVTGAIDPTKVNIDQITGFILGYPWQPNNVTGPQTFWIDNIIFQTNLTKNLNPPTLSLRPASSISGLQDTAAATGQYSRNSIATLPGADFGWVNAAQPITYSLTIADFPPVSATNFQTHIFLASNPGTENSPDWNEANAVFLDIQRTGDGGATATFRYKTNSPGANAMMYNANPTNGPVGVLGILAASTPLGTWSMTFRNDTNVTVLGPGGVSTNFSFPDAGAVQAAFPASVSAYFGVQPNQTYNQGKSATFSRVQITGVATPIDDSFNAGVLNTNVWIKRADDPGGLVIIGGNDLYWLTWTLPDLGFTEVQVSADLSPSSWVDTYLYTNAVLQGSSKTVKITKADVPSLSHSYFRMLKRVATKLQVLLPGETNAPDTPTGKTGTPTPITVGMPIDVVVNACDDTWRIMTGCNDQVQFSSTDPNAFLPGTTPGLVTLANGTATLVGFTFLNPGTWTITATDNSNSKVAAGVSTPVIIP